MYNVYFYQDENGKQPVKEYLDELEEKSAKSKDARIKYNKIDQYIGILICNDLCQEVNINKNHHKLLFNCY